MAANAATPKPRKTTGFGFDAERSPHHFAVVFDRQGNAGIYERHEAPEAEEGQTGRLGIGVPKAALTAYLWGRIAETAANDFNRRLRGEGMRAGQWRGREVALAPYFGKELTLLAWAVESQDADPTPVPAMLANWSGLAPEERWGFYTTINATGGHAEHGRDRGWRRAIKIAFAENPVQVGSTILLTNPTPKPRNTRGRPAKTEEAADVSQGRLRLWDDEGATA